MSLSKNRAGAIAASCLAIVVATSCCWVPALMALFGGAAGVFGAGQSSGVLQGVFLVLVVASVCFAVWKLNKLWKSNRVELNSVVTCPHCSVSAHERMPENACQFFYECTGCGEILKPIPGDCCVYCSYGTVKCPPIQKGEDCC